MQRLHNSGDKHHDETDVERPDKLTRYQAPFTRRIVGTLLKVPKVSGIAMASKGALRGCSKRGDGIV